MKVIVVCPAFNNVKYTKMFLDSIVTSYPYEVLVIDNGSSDDTPKFLKDRGVNCIRYNENRGFSYAYNEAMDYAFRDDSNLLLFCGNDTVLRPKSIDHLVQGILESDYEMLCGNEVLSKEILQENQEAIANFNYKFSFEVPEDTELRLSYGGMNHSCMIRQKSVFDVVGYYDVHFYPAYFEDNDYARRCDLLGIKYGTVDSAVFYHFWSRSIHEGGLRDLNSRRFDHNKSYYLEKWGGGVGKEVHTLPFDGEEELRISGRGEEYLRELGVI